jgi:hypothetical protein
MLKFHAPHLIVCLEVKASCLFTVIGQLQVKRLPLVPFNLVSQLCNEPSQLITYKDAVFKKYILESKFRKGNTFILLAQ